MPRLEYSFMDAISYYVSMAADFKAFPIFAIAGLVFVLLVAFNMENKNANFLFYGLNLLLIGIIIFTKGLNILDNYDNIFSGNIFKNMYFYLVDMLIALVVVSKIYQSKRVTNKFKYFIFVLYYFLIINLFFMIYVSNYFNNVEVFVIGNVYPMVYLGNIVCFMLYLSIIMNWLIVMPKKRKHRLGNHL